MSEIDGRLAFWIDRMAARIASQVQDSGVAFDPDRLDAYLRQAIDDERRLAEELLLERTERSILARERILTHVYLRLRGRR